MIREDEGKKTRAGRRNGVHRCPDDRKTKRGSKRRQELWETEAYEDGNNFVYHEEVGGKIRVEGSATEVGCVS